MQPQVAAVDPSKCVVCPCKLVDAVRQPTSESDLRTSTCAKLPKAVRSSLARGLPELYACSDTWSAVLQGKNIRSIWAGCGVPSAHQRVAVADMQNECSLRRCSLDLPGFLSSGGGVYAGAGAVTELVYGPVVDKAHLRVKPAVGGTQVWVLPSGLEPHTPGDPAGRTGTVSVAGSETGTVPVAGSAMQRCV